jgi:hypothetical protein
VNFVKNCSMILRTITTGVLLPNDDLFYMKRTSNGLLSVLHTDLSKDLKFTASEATLAETSCTIFRGPKRARLFNTEDDWRGESYLCLL